jgi:putative PIN family toxin of toxin-antitoxin system
MTPSERVVFDSNVLISRALLPTSIPARAVRKAVDNATILVSEAILDELTEVLSRPKFDRYVTIAERQEFLKSLGRIAEMIPITYTVRACRDPRDDKILELAVNGGATVVVTGDKDLLPLNPFRDIPIVTPAEYLAR